MATDNFTNVNGTPLATHNPKWTAIDATYGVSDRVINGNLCEATGTYKYCGAYYSNSQPADQSSQIVNKASTAANKHVAVRCSAGNRGYSAYFGGTVVDGKWPNLYLAKNGSWVKTISVTGGILQAADNTVKISATGASSVTIEVWLNGVSQGTHVDASSPITTGYPGFWTPQIDTIANSRFDDWTDGISAGFSATIDTAYKIYNAPSIAAAWRIATAGAGSTAWRLFGSATLPSAWKLFSWVDMGSSWKIINADTSGTGWRMFTSNTVEAAWQILTAGTSSINVAWRILAAATSISSWRILAGAELLTAWTVLHVSSDSAAWKIFADDVAGTEWQIFTAASMDSAWGIDSEIRAGVEAVIEARARCFSVQATEAIFALNAKTKTFIIFAED